jgi:hypothetical protein
VIPELAGTLDPIALAAMKKEAGVRKKSKMTAYATEVQQYRWFDRNLTDNLANRLLRIDLDSKRLTDLTPGYPRLFTPSGEVRFDVAPDGRRAVLVIDSSPAPFVAAPNPDLYLLSTDGKGAMRNLTADNPRVDESPRFTPDGKSLLFVRQRQSLAPGAGELRRLWRYRFDSARAEPVAADLDLSIDGLAFSADGRSLSLSCVTGLCGAAERSQRASRKWRCERSERRLQRRAAATRGRARRCLRHEVRRSLRPHRPHEAALRLVGELDERPLRGQEIRPWHQQPAAAGPVRRPRQLPDSGTLTRPLFRLRLSHVYRGRNARRALAWTSHWKCLSLRAT